MTLQLDSDQILDIEGEGAAVEITTELPISELEKRWGVSRASLYNRLNGLGIQTIYRGGRSYIDSSHLATLDNLDEHLKARKPMKTFLSPEESEPPNVAQTSETVPLSRLPQIQQRSVENSPGVVSTLVDAIAKISDLSQAMIQTSAPTPASWETRLELLDKAARRRWHLTSSQIKDLLGLKNLPSGGHFQRHGFDFRRLGRVGPEYEWRIEKP